jgi:acyl-CoA synthetase (AMP-forming)/AMP-acid ligase II
MPMFFAQINRFGQQNAVFDGSKWLSYVTLDDLVQKQKVSFVKTFGTKKQVIAMTAGNTLQTLVNYLALLQLRQAILFVGSKATLTEHSGDTMSLCERFNIRFHLNEDALNVLDVSSIKNNPSEIELDANIALLMGTSGSTGAAKYVMLSYDNLQHNAQDICAYLPIQASDKTITTLPFSYAYGLSIINTHLLKGAGILMTSYSVMQREFWELLTDHKVSSFGGVPYTYEMLLRLRFTQKTLPDLRYFTQAGGKLAPQHLASLLDFARQYNKQFFVMYGQTEATARMSYADIEKLTTKPASIGCAIPNAEFLLFDENKQAINKPNQEGELAFKGSNVMLGYADSIDDLVNVKPLALLETGDLAYFDDQGDYYISGRIKRIIKLFGERFNLDDLQQKASTFFGTQNIACVGDDKQLCIVIENNSSSELTSDEYEHKRKAFAKILKLNQRSISVSIVDEFYRTQNGKLDYSRLQAQVMEG